MGKKRLAVVAEPTKEVTTSSVPSLPSVASAKEGVIKKPIRKRVRSARYRQALTKIDRTQAYSLPQAIKLLKQVSLAKFDASVEAHLNLTETNLKVKVTFPHPASGTMLKSGSRLVSGEPKSPLMHVVVGKLSMSDHDLTSNISALVSAVTLKRITKLTLASTMSPGIKVVKQEPHAFS